MNSSILTERTCHIYSRLFDIQGWKEAGDIIMHQIPGIINPVDDLTKPSGWVLHYRNAVYMMGRYNISLESSIHACQFDRIRSIHLIGPSNIMCNTLVIIFTIPWIRGGCSHTELILFLHIYYSYI